jgi:hypothetical protein
VYFRRENPGGSHGSTKSIRLFQKAVRAHRLDIASPVFRTEVVSWLTWCRAFDSAGQVTVSRRTACAHLLTSHRLLIC